jgi:TQXA domain-containing protein/LPXTG-motif cell wall-anchored protein
MTIGRRRGPARRLTAATLAFVAAGAASLIFQSSAKADAVSGSYTGSEFGSSVRLEGHHSPSGTSLLDLKLADGTVVKTYCIDIHTGLNTKATYQESDWNDQHPGPNRDKINWILHHSFPEVSVDSLAASANAAGLSTKEAVAGTQAAVWHFSDGVKISDSEKDAKVKAVYAYLTGAANTGLSSQPPVSLSLSPNAHEGKAGSKIGPFTVSTTSKSALTVAGENLPQGVQILKGGSPAKTAGDKDQLWVDVPASLKGGSATFKVSGSAPVQTGRVFMVFVHGNPAKSQVLIVASGGETKVSAEATATWTQTAPSGLSASAVPNCASTGLEVTVKNAGTVAAEFKITGVEKPVAVAPGKSETVIVPVKNGEKYSVEVTGSGFKQTFAGTLSCEVSPSPSPTQAQGSTLPVTGASTALVVGLGALLLGGGAMMVFTAKRRRNAHER